MCGTGSTSHTLISSNLKKWFIPFWTIRGEWWGNCDDYKLKYNVNVNTISPFLPFLSRSTCTTWRRVYFKRERGNRYLHVCMNSQVGSWASKNSNIFVIDKLFNCFLQKVSCEFWIENTSNTRCMVSGRSGVDGCHCHPRYFVPLREMRRCGNKNQTYMYSTYNLYLWLSGTISRFSCLILIHPKNTKFAKKLTSWILDCGNRGIGSRRFQKTVELWNLIDPCKSFFKATEDHKWAVEMQTSLNSVTTAFSGLGETASNMISQWNWKMPSNSSKACKVFHLI